jgi:hypothetical protein
MFFIIYCPSNVGMNSPDQVIFDKRISGAVVVMRWRMIKNVASFVNRGNKNRIPINISNTANSFKNNAGAIIGRVLPSRARTNGVAGLIPISFKIPNQKNTTNNATLLIDSDMD